MAPLKIKLGSLPKPAVPTPAPGAPAPVANNNVRPTASGSQTTAVKSPKAKKPGDTGMMNKSDNSNKGISKLKMFMDNRAGKKNKVLKR
jgi:hypothetical protein